jgi:hypothetical protein
MSEREDEDTVVDVSAVRGVKNRMNGIQKDV